MSEPPAVAQPECPDPKSVPKVGVAVFGRGGRLLLHTPRFAELLKHVCRSIAPGLALEDVLRPLGGPGALSGVHFSTPDGRAIDVAFERLPRGRSSMTVTDVTETRAAEDELRRARAAAEAANQAKSIFLATMTHELRTPLNAVIGFSEALAQPGEQTPQVTEFAMAIHQAGEHLLDRINTILDIARIESGRFELASDVIDIDYMLQHSVLQMQPKAEAARVSVTTEVAPELPRLRADERRLRQVIRHLLGNAVKFSPCGGEVVVSACCTPDSGDLVIAIRDNGIGIAAADLARVFQPFNQLDSSLARRNAGAGLGLYASRSLATALGGRISLDSDVGRGTTAIVEFPHHRLTPLPSNLELTQAPP